jgi:hypothetical protein
MELNEVPEICRGCCNLKAWNIKMNGDHDYSCLMKGTIGMKHMKERQDKACEYIYPVEGEQ